MDSTDQQGAEFELPPAKRQCTQSPKLSPIMGAQSKSPAKEAAFPPILTETAAGMDTTVSGPGLIPIPGLGSLDVEGIAVRPTEIPESNGILDVLLQHVESASNPTAIHEPAEDADTNQNLDIVAASDPPSDPSDVPVIDEKHSPEEGEGNTAHKLELPRTIGDTHPDSGLETTMEDTSTRNVPEPVLSSAEGDTRPVEIELPNQEGQTEAAEWEADSSPLELSSTSDSSDSSSSEEESDEEMDGEYAMLGLEEQARILMQGDGGSDDEGGDRKGGDKAAAQLRTTNEKPEEVIPKPNITLTDEKIEELGVVEGIVESAVLIKAKISGEYQVLESGSLLCLKDRTVVGVVAELFGRVEQPMYTVRFTNDAAIEEAGLSTLGTAVYYVEPPHSTFVFTQPLKSIKGSDASNFHDEEVGDDEMEFSDDEMEAEHKRRLKLKRQGRRDDRGGRTANRNDTSRSSVSHIHDGSANGSAYGTGAIEMNYDDVDEGYTPLARPPNLHVMGQGDPPLPTRPPSSRGNNDRGRARGRGRGRGSDRGRGRGNRFNGQNSHDQAQGNDRHAPDPTFSPHTSNAAPAFVPPPTSPYQYQPFQQPFQQQPFQQAYQQPHGPPQMPSYPPFSPSPISPLPNTNFNFNTQHPYNFNAQQPQQWPHQNQNQYGNPQHVPSQPQMAMPPPGSHINPAFLEALRQHQRGQGR